MDEQLRQESLESFHNLLGNVKFERFFTTDNNSKDDINLLHDLLDLHHNKADNLLDIKSIKSLNQTEKVLGHLLSDEDFERAFKAEINLHSDTFIIFSRNNGIPTKTKKKGLYDMTSHKNEINMDQRKVLDTEENYQSLPPRDSKGLDFTLHPPNVGVEMTNFESLGPCSKQKSFNEIPVIQMENIEAFSSYHNTYDKDRLQENVPFLLRHPSARNSKVGDGSTSNNVTIEKPIQQDFKLHEMSFNKDQLNSTIKTAQDTARSLQTAGPYELIEEEDILSPSKAKSRFKLPSPPDRPQRLSELQNETKLLRQSFEEERIQPLVQRREEGFIRKAASEKILKENRELNNNSQVSKNEEKIEKGSSSEAFLINLFYQMVNENKFLKEETKILNERIDDLSKHQETETEIVFNLQKNLELTMMLLKKRDEDFNRLQKQYDELSKKFDGFVAQNSKPVVETYSQHHSRSNSFILNNDLDDINASKDVSTNRTGRRSPSYMNNYVPYNNIPRVTKNETNRNYQPSHEIPPQRSFPQQNPDKHSDFNNDVPHNSFYDQRSSNIVQGNARGQQKIYHTLERNDSGFAGYDTYGDIDDSYEPIKESHNQSYNQNARNSQKQPRRTSFLNQPPLIQENEDIRYGANKNHALLRNDYTRDSRDREKISSKENKSRLNQGSKSPRPSPLQTSTNSGWGGIGSRSNVEQGNDLKGKAKAQNYKKYSELFRKQKEVVEQGNNILKEEIRGKLLHRK